MLSEENAKEKDRRFERYYLNGKMGIRVDVPPGELVEFSKYVMKREGGNGGGASG